MSKFQISIVIYITVLVASSIWLYPIDITIFLEYALGITFAYSFLLFVMSMWIQQDFFLTSIHQNKNNSIVLSFDDGPHPEFTPKILDALDQHHIKALFFVIGKNVNTYPEITKEIIKRGHQIGAHTQSHSYFFGLFGQNKVKEELQLCVDSIKSATGYQTHLFRPPFGVTNPIIAREVHAQSLISIGWNVRSYDTTTKNVETIINRVTSSISAKSIVLLHDRLPQTCDALPTIIEKIKGMGFDIGPIELTKND